MESKGDNSITIAWAENPITVTQAAQTRRFPNATFQSYQIRETIIFIQLHFQAIEWIQSLLLPI